MKLLLQWARRGTISIKPENAKSVSDAHARQQGQVLVLFALFFAVVLGAAALVLDLGLLRKANMDLYNALDAGALAGVARVLDDPAEAERLAREYVHTNYPGALPDSDINVSFSCLIGVENGSPRLADVPFACDPGPSATWVIDGTRATAACDPTQAHVCNVIVVGGPAEIDFKFAPVLGVSKGSVGVRTAAACKGLCGEPPEIPLDLVIILDRTGSMSGVDTDNARAAAEAVRMDLDPDVQWLAFGVLGPSDTAAVCKTAKASSIGQARPIDLRRWVPIGLTGTGAIFGQDYLSDPTMANAIACFGNSSTGTDLADPIYMATYELENFGRPNSIKAILLLSDGQPNNSTTGAAPENCYESNNRADDAKLAGIEIFTVGFGLDGSNDKVCPDNNAAWVGKTATDLLATMATDSDNSGCPGTENDDGDHYFCVPKSAGASADLTDVFFRVVSQLSSHSRLIKVPE